MDHIIIVAVFIAVGIAIAALIIIFVKQQKKKLQDIAESLGATIDGTNLKGLHNGIPYRCEYFAGSQHAPSQIRIVYDHPFPVKMQIRKEGKFDRFAKRIGLSSEVQTGNRVFDDTYYIDTPHSEFAVAYFQAGLRQEAINNLFARAKNMSVIGYTNEFVVATISPCELDADVINQDLIGDVLESLSDIARDPPAAPMFGIALADKSSKLSLILLFVLAGLSFFVGIMSFIFGLSMYEPLEKSLIVDSFWLSIPAFIVFVFASYFVMRGNSSAGRNLIILIAVALPGFIFFGIGGVIFTNGYFDESMETKHLCAVEEKIQKKSDDSMRYYIFVPPWREGLNEQKIKVSHNFYEQIEAGDEVTIATKSGRWGYEWLVDYQKVEVSK